MAKKSKGSAKSFYAKALSEAERVELEQAMEVEGLDEEIALLRLRLREALSQHPENTQLLLRGVELLVKAVGAKYRLTKDGKKNLTDAITGVLKELGSILLPEVL
jgi:hypothetical protein